MFVRTIRTAAFAITATTLVACDATEATDPLTAQSAPLQVELLDARIDGRAAVAALPGAPLDIQLSADFDGVECVDCRVQIVVHVGEEARCVADTPARGAISIGATMAAPKLRGDHLVRWQPVFAQDCAEALEQAPLLPELKEPIGAITIVPEPAPANRPPRLIGREITPATDANGCETRVRYGAEDVDGDALTYTMAAGREVYPGVNELSIPRRENRARTVAILVTDGRGGVDLDLVRLPYAACAAHHEQGEPSVRD